MEPLQFTSLPSLFFTNCNRTDFEGWFQRVNGEWIHFSREKIKRETEALALAFHDHGIKEKESIGIIAPSSPAWVFADIAAQINHAAIVPLFPNISFENFDFQCKDANVQILVIYNISDLEAPLREKLSRFKTVICIDPTTELPENGIYWDDLIKDGYGLLQEESAPQWIESQIHSIHPDDLFSIIYTSGSTGTPKGVDLSHRNMLSQIQNLLPRFPLYRKTDTALTVLPVAHAFERMAVYFYILNGITLYFADDPKNLPAILPEVRPTLMIVVPRILERLYDKMTAAGDKARGPKRWLVKQAIKIAKIENPTKRPSLMRRLCDKLVYKKMREAIGGNFRLIVSGGSALNKSICRFLLNIGLTVYEGYGLTECSPVISVNYAGNMQPGSVGKPLAHLDVKIGDNSEVLAKGDSVFKGYHNLPELNKEIFTSDGYFRTGDQGQLDEEGYLSLTGRIKELLKTSTGKYVSPNPIELEICRHPLIEAALVVANNRKFASVLVFLNDEYAKRMLKKTKADFDISKAMQSKHINEAISRHIGRINKKLNHWEQIRKWTLVGDPLTIESGLLTPTLKLRRKATEEKYAQQIEKMYQ
ncbi:MAG: long-chain fatty acid--CoA ligase [Fibrobacteraceae bacterium]|nr:long-chain fatty acid--CoA ligase [Fibrobacteraceae bacterium]